MATKKISELTNVTSVQNTDLLIVETSNGTRSVKKSDFVSDVNSTLNGKQNKIKTSSVTLSSSGWNGSGTKYTQVVNISGGKSNSKIDLQPDSTVLSKLISDKVSAIYVENNNGVFTACAINAKPTVDLNIQITIMEVD